MFKENNYKILLVFVGLPASGKSYTSFHIHQYFNWLGIKTKIYNCGNYRRNLCRNNQDALFFDNKNENYVKIRESYLHHALFDINYYFLKQNGKIAILDATNSTKIRRKKILKFFDIFGYNIKTIFIENITIDKNIIEKNILFKKNSKDYCNFSIEEMKKDFNQRLEFYKENYNSIEECEQLNYIKFFDCGRKVEYFNIEGLIECMLLTFLINFKVSTKQIYITRHGESLYNLEGKIGGDSDISEEGKKYSVKLYNYISLQFKPEDIIIFTSNLKRTINTAKLFIENNYNVIHKEVLNEINGGVCEHLTYDEVASNFPIIHSQRSIDKFNFKYPEGESYKDLIIRLKEFILELNRIEKPVLIICHNAIVRVLYSYFFSIEHKKIPHQNIPLHSLECISNDTYFYKKEKII